MSIITYQNFGEDRLNPGTYAPYFMFGNGLIREGSSTHYDITGRQGVKLEFQGPEFTYNGKGDLQSGHATSCTIIIDGVISATITDIDVGAKELKALNTPEEFYKLLGKVSATGSAGNDVIFGGDKGDVINAGDGDDTIYGGKGDDQLYGGDGDDGLLFDKGHDKLDGGAGQDYAAFSGLYVGNDHAPDFDIDLRDTGYQKVAKGVEIKLVSVEGLAGGDGDDKLTGDGQANLLGGGEGKDTISGGAGDDTIYGGFGNDVLKGGSGEDTLDFSGANKGVHVSTAGKGVQNTGGEGKDKISGFEDLAGSYYNDKLIGDKEHNHIAGRDGDDTIIGGGGRDGLEGGTGADTFVFNKAFMKYGAFTEIQDFKSSEHDLIDLSAIDANVNASGNQDFVFIGTGAFTGAAGQLRWQYFGNDPTRDIFIQGDVDGDGKGDFIIQLRGPLGSLSGSDFDF